MIPNNRKSKRELAFDRQLSRPPKREYRLPDEDARERKAEARKKRRQNIALGNLSRMGD